MRCLKIAVALSVAGLGILVGSNNAQAAIFFDPRYGYQDIFPVYATVCTTDNDCVAINNGSVAPLSVATLKNQPWWCDPYDPDPSKRCDPSPAPPNAYSPAQAFAYDVNNYFSLPFGLGPIFAFYDDGTYTYDYFYYQGLVYPWRFPNNFQLNYAIAAFTPSPVPEPSEVLGAVVLSVLCLAFKFKCLSLFK